MSLSRFEAAGPPLPRFPEKAVLQTHSGLLAAWGPQTRVRAPLNPRLHPESSCVSGRPGPSQEVGGDRPRLAQSRDIGDEKWPCSHEAGPRAQVDAQTAMSRESARHGWAPEGRRVVGMPGCVCGCSGWDGHAELAAQGPGILRWAGPAWTEDPSESSGHVWTDVPAAHRGCLGPLSCTLR